MGSLGDKFKKLAAEQTRQLLQNFQNAQSSKTRNGYSYGKLNEDGTATLADGTTVQVEVKGRPGQYAPVFNLGNGQGLVDQPEAKFFNVDSNLDKPFALAVQYDKPFDNQSLTIISITITDSSGNKFLLPQELWPISHLEAYQNPPFFGSNFLVTCSAGYGGFVVLVYSTANNAYTKRLGGLTPIQAMPAYYLIVNSFGLSNNTITVPEGQYEKGTFDYSTYLTTPTVARSFNFPSRTSISGSSGCDDGVETVGIVGVTVQTGSVVNRVDLRPFIRGRQEGKLLIDLSIFGSSQYESTSVGNFTDTQQTVLGFNNYHYVAVYDLIEPPADSSQDIIYGFQYSLLYNGSQPPQVTPNRPVGSGRTVIDGVCTAVNLLPGSQGESGASVFRAVLENWPTTPSLTADLSIQYDYLQEVESLDSPIAIITNGELFNTVWALRGGYLGWTQSVALSPTGLGYAPITLHEGYASGEVYEYTPVFPYPSPGDYRGWPIAINNNIPVLYYLGGTSTLNEIDQAPLYHSKYGIYLTNFVGPLVLDMYSNPFRDTYTDVKLLKIAIDDSNNLYSIQRVYPIGTLVETPRNYYLTISFASR